jgi:phosphomannomutase
LAHSLCLTDHLFLHANIAKIAKSQRVKEKKDLALKVDSLKSSLPAQKIEELARKYSDGKIDRMDGLSVEYPNWRFNLRMSNTEPIVRLNVETKRDMKLLEEKTDELLKVIRG